MSLSLMARMYAKDLSGGNLAAYAASRLAKKIG